MITTTHAILNTALLGRKNHPERNWPVILGSIFPDLPMILFALLMVFTHGNFHPSGKAGFLSEYHFRQLWVDWGHSIPLALAGMLLCYFLKRDGGFYFFSAMGLHDLEDLPVHSEYAHRHFCLSATGGFSAPFPMWTPGITPRSWRLWNGSLSWFVSVSFGAADSPPGSRLFYCSSAFSKDCGSFSNMEASDGDRSRPIHPMMNP